MESLNIVQLIEKNAMTRLSKDYENKLINKIQQIFVASFYTFLKYDLKKDFVIDFDNVWKWLGYSRKDPAKRLLEKFFTIDIDYKLAPCNSGASFEGLNKVEIENNINEPIHGGQNKENILLNVNTFKKFCLKAGTKRADEVHDYYIKLEELLQETINEETNELRLQLQITDDKLKEETMIRKNLKAKYECFLYRRIDIDNKYEKGFCVYIIGFVEILGKYKIGCTDNLKKRIGDYHTEVPYEPIVHYVKYYSSDAKPLEQVLHHILRKFRIHNSKEYFQTDDVQIFIDEVDDVFTFFENKDKKYENVKDVKDDLLDEIKKEKEEVEKLEKENSDYKKCSKCKSVLLKNEFVNNKRKKDGLESYCKSCGQEKYKKLKNKEKVMLEEKKCTKCDKIKDISEFYNRIGSSDGKTSECKDCSMDMYYDRTKERTITIHLENKKCMKCNETLDINEFGNKKDSPDGRMPNCKKCCSENAKQLRSLEPEYVPDLKACNQCNTKLSIECYWNNKSNKDGKDNKCITCQKENKLKRKEKV